MYNNTKDVNQHCAGENHVEIVTEDGEDVMVRYKRSAGECRYKKGQWAACDQMTMVRDVTSDVTSVMSTQSS